MKTIKVGKVTLGIILIIFGLSIYLGQTRGYQWFDTIANFWPLALVGLGIEYVIAAKDYEAKVSLSKSSVLLMAVVLLAAYSYAEGHGLTVLNLFTHNPLSTINIGLSNARESYTLTMEIDEILDSGQGRIELSNVSGNIRLQGSETTRVSGKIQITARAATVEEAQKLAESIEIEKARLGNTLSLIPRPPHKINQQYSVSFDLDIPDSADVEIETVSGDTEIEGVKGAVMADSVSGDMELDGLPGSVRVKTVSGSVEATLGTAMDRLAIETVSGAVDIEVPPETGGTVKAETVSGKISAKDPGVSITERPGHKSASGKIGSGNTIIEIETVSGNVKFSD
ncbi:MAG: DUF4097 family beta strand repeat-containing protein [Bacillota bacterium]